MYQVSTDAPPPQTPPSDLQPMRQQQLHSGELMPPQPHSNNPQEPHPIPQQPGKTTHAATNAATPAAINCASTSLDKATNKFFRQFDPTGFWTTTTGAPTIVITC